MHAREAPRPWRCALGGQRLQATFDSACADLCGSPYNQCSLEPAYSLEFVARRDAAKSAGDATDGEGGAVTTQRCPTRTAMLACSHSLGCIGGRATDGIPAIAADLPADAHPFVAMARLEAVSVMAFERLRADLEALGVPPALVRSAHDAAIDEGRHANEVARLALRDGELPSRADLGTIDEAPRSLLSIALENAREGGVRESYGALVCAYAAQTSDDPVVRETMRSIAGDESRHAAFSWDLDAWAKSRLGLEDRATVDRARDDALADLEREVIRTASSFRWTGANDESTPRLLLASMKRAFFMTPNDDASLA